MSFSSLLKLFFKHQKKDEVQPFYDLLTISMTSSSLATRLKSLAGCSLSMPGLDLVYTVAVFTVAGSREEAARCVYAKYASISLHISNYESERQRGNSPPM